MPTVSALEYVQTSETPLPEGAAVAYGGEAFLRRLVLDRWTAALAGDDAEAGLSQVSGKTVEPARLSDLLATRSLFGGGPSVVLMDEADDFVSAHRGWLENYLSAPRRKGVLLLVVASWPSNTRLYKLFDAGFLQVDCSTPKPAVLAKWLPKRAKQQHGLRLEPDAAELLRESAGESIGLLDQELAKLSLVAGESGAATAELVERYCGGWKAKTAWAMLDAALDGQAQSALEQLDRLLAAGESPIGVLGQISASLRRLHAATRYVEADRRRGRRPNLSNALAAAGVKRFVLAKSEQQLRRIGRERAGRIDHMLLAADLALKGASSAPARARLALERVVLELAAPGPAPAKSSGR